jgi:hypothetical protein
MGNSYYLGLLLPVSKNLWDGVGVKEKIALAIISLFNCYCILHQSLESSIIIILFLHAGGSEVQFAAEASLKNS